MAKGNGALKNQARTQGYNMIEDLLIEAGYEVDRVKGGLLTNFDGQHVVFTVIVKDENKFDKAAALQEEAERAAKAVARIAAAAEKAAEREAKAKAKAEAAAVKEEA